MPKIRTVVVLNSRLRQKDPHFGWRHRWRQRLRNLFAKLLFYCSLLFIENVWNVLRKVMWQVPRSIAQWCDLSAAETTAWRQILKVLRSSWKSAQVCFRPRPTRWRCQFYVKMTSSCCHAHFTHLLREKSKCSDCAENLHDFSLDIDRRRGGVSFFDLVTSSPCHAHLRTCCMKIQSAQIVLQIFSTDFQFNRSTLNSWRTKRWSPQPRDRSIAQ